MDVTGRALKIALFTFVVSLIISYTFQFSLVFWVSGLILLVILLTGIFFDIIGTAATAASEVPFHAMGADKVDGSKQAIYLIRNADKVANFCNDVVGDISGTISGAIIASISLAFLQKHLFLPERLVGAISIALLAALTVGGKAIAKSYAIANAHEVIFTVGKILHFLKFNGFNPAGARLRANKRKTGLNSRKVRKG